MRNRPEHELQCSIIVWAETNENIHPELHWLYAIPNGSYKSAKSAKDFKEEGLKSGVPDLCLPIPRGGYGALYIELKSPVGKLSENQRKWLQGLTDVGNLCLEARTYERVTQVIVDYLKGKYERSN